MNRTPDTHDGALPSGLPVLLDRVRTLRSREHECLKGHARPDAVREARRDTLKALLEYADAIEARSWPVPRGILSDIRLHQALMTRSKLPYD